MLPKTFVTFLKIFPIFFIIIFLATWGILDGYFEQDEWSALSSTMRAYNLPWWNVFVPTEVHFSPLGVIFWRMHYALFNLQAHFYFITELIIHTSSAVLAYILALRLAKNKSVALITGLLFLLNGRAYQAFTHLAIFNTTDTTMFLILLFFVYLSGIKEKILPFKKTTILFLIFLTAVHFREEGFIIIPLSIVYLACFDRQKINKDNSKHFVLFGLGLFLILGIRFLAQELKEVTTPAQYQLTGRRAIYNFITIPVKLVIQNLINSANIGVFFLNYHNKIYPDMIKNIYTQAAPLMDMAVFFIFSIITAISGVWLWATRPKRIGLFLTFCLSWICFHAFMLSFVGHPLYVLEPRYLYFSSFPVFFLLALFIHSVFTSHGKILFLDLLKKLFIVLILITLFVTSFMQIRTAVEYASRSGIIKKRVMESLLNAHPHLSNNTIFFVKCKDVCNRNGELGIPNENVLPFSSGPGLNILITYASVQNQEKEWGPFFTDYFLFHIYSEDYKKIGDRSFGYFTTESKLSNLLEKNSLPPEIVVALEYDEDNYTFRDISEEFRKTLIKE